MAWTFKSYLLWVLVRNHKVSVINDSSATKSLQQSTVAVGTFEWRHLLGDDDDDDDECPSRRLINNLADISDKAIPAKRRDRKNGHHSNTMEVFMKKGEEKTTK